MIDFTNDYEWDTIANSVLSAIPVKNDYNEWLNVVSLAKEAEFSREDVVNYCPGNSEGLDEAKWAALPQKNDKTKARTILYSIAKENGFISPEIASKKQNINWITHVQDESTDRLNDFTNARKLLQILYGNGIPFTICQGKFSQKARKHIPDSGSIRQITYSQITDELLNQLYYGTTGAYIILNPVDPAKLQDSVKAGKGVKADMLTDYPYFFIESDPDRDCDYDLYIENQKKLLSGLDIPWIAMIHSGNKSIHTIIRTDAKSADEFKVNLEKIHTYLKEQHFKFDESNKNPNKWSRFFTAGRQQKKQHVIAINSKPTTFTDWYNRHPELQPKKSCDGLFTGGKVDTTGFYSLMQTLNVYRVNEDGKHKAVQTDGKFIKEITIADVSDIFSDYIDASGIELNDLESKSLHAFKKGLNETVFRNFKGLKPLIHTDSKDIVYLYFKNGYLEINKNSVILNDYEKLNGYIWADAYKSMNYQYIPADKNESIFSKFLNLIAGSSENFDKFKSAIGFAISRFKTRINNRALFLTDKKAEIDSDISTGGTGKGLILNALQIFRSAGEIDGKALHSDDRFAYSAYEDGQSLYVINDISNTFKIESVYNQITDKFIIEKKGKDKRVIEFVDSPKIILTSNSYPRNMDSESTLRRLCILELDNVFNSDFTPFDKFGCEFYSADWDEAEWARFFAFIIACVQFYLANGLITTNSTSTQQKIIESGINPVVQEFVDMLSAGQYGLDRLWLRFKEEFWLNRSGAPKFKVNFAKSLSKIGRIEKKHTNTGNIYIVKDTDNQRKESSF